MLWFSMQRPLCFCTTSPLKMLPPHTPEQQMKSILSAAFGRTACRRKRNDCSLLSLCARSGLQMSRHHRTEVRKLRGMHESTTSTASAADQKLAHTHTDSHAHQRRTSKVDYSPPPKAAKHKAPQRGPPRLRSRSFSAYFNKAIKEVCYSRDSSEG